MDDQPDTQRNTWTKVVYPCDQCEFTGSEFGVRRHIQIKHKGIRYPCDQCDYVAATLGNLNKRKQSIHEKNRYPCDKCEHAATSVSNFKKT